MYVHNGNARTSIRVVYPAKYQVYRITIVMS